MTKIQEDFYNKWKRCKEEGRIGEYDGIRIITSNKDKAALFINKTCLLVQIMVILPMDSPNTRRDVYVSSILTLQQDVTFHYKKERRLVESLMGEILRVSGGECIIVRKKTESGHTVLGHRYYDDSACSDKKILDRIGFLAGEAPQVPLSDSGESWSLSFEPSVPLCSERRRLSHAMNICSSPFVEDPMDVLVINRVPGLDDRELAGFIESMINLVCQAAERGRLEGQLSRKDKLIAREVESKNQFLGSLSHEIRSPLNGIICMGSLLKETQLDEEQLDLLNIIQFSADNITRIVQDLVDLTLLTSGRVILKNETFSLTTLCGNLIKNMKEEASGKGLELGVHIDEDVDLFHGDSVRIGQILSNLIQNAIKYTREGEIFLDIRRRDGVVEFVVSDTGVGIPRDKQDMIFEEFIQLGNPVQKDKARGVGLGLAIVKDLVEMMGGNVSVKSREGKGSSFLVILPDMNVEEKKPEKKESNPFRSDPGNASFLVVDDDEINRLYLKMVLEGIGASIDEAENGQLAVEKVAGNTYDMVLMDISMPVMNGLDATREIRKMQKNLPVLAVTANAFDEDFKRILESGLDDIVLKPVDEEQLMNKISNWLGRSRGNE